jgi:hypothetical protein
MPEFKTFQPDFKPIHLGGRVYRVSDDKAAKIVDESDLEEIKREEETGRVFYNEGIAVAKPFGIYRIPRRKGIVLRRTELNPALLREYLEGIPLSNLSGDKFKVAMDSFNRQLEHAERIGYDAWDLHFANSLWVPSRNKTHLLDLDSFGKIQ